MRQILAFTLFFSMEMVSGQGYKFPMFEVKSIAEKINYSKSQLNSEIAKCVSKDCVKAIILSKKFAEGRLLFQIRQKDNTFIPWVITTHSAHEVKENTITLQSRGTPSLTLYNVSDFKTLFADTLILFDTLAISLKINDKRYPNDGFVAETISNTSERITRQIPLRDKTLLIFPSLFDVVEPNLLQIRIYNTGNPDRTISNCKLYFLQEEDLFLIKDYIKGFLYPNQPNSTKDITESTSLFIRKYYGLPFYSQLDKWIADQTKNQWK